MAWGFFFFMPRCSSAQRSVAFAWGEKCKQVVSGVRGVCGDVTCPFLHSGVVHVLKAGQVDTNDPFCCPNSPLQSSYIWFAGCPKPDSYSGAQNRLNNSRVNLCHMRWWQRTERKPIFLFCSWVISNTISMSWKNRRTQVTFQSSSRVLISGNNPSL